MKKHEFEGLDLMCVEKFKAPIEKFNTNNDLQKWAGNKLKEITNKDFKGRQEETRIQRKALIKEWSDYVINENDVYNNAAALLIMSAVTKNLTPNNDYIPPALNKGVLADTIHTVKETKADIHKTYMNKLKEYYFEDTNTGEEGTKWIKIPSKKNDPENFDENVNKLKALSHKSWCTKSLNAKPYLAKGDFHIYLENGEPKVGIRLYNDEIYEIQGQKNNNKIPIEYFDIVNNYIDENNLSCDYKAYKELIHAQKIKKRIEKAKKDLRNDINTNNVENIMRYFGLMPPNNIYNKMMNFIKPKEVTDENGLLIIDKYQQPKDLTFTDIGIDENKLFEKIGKIKGNANFGDSNATNLGNLTVIEGDARFRDSQITSLGNLKRINKNAFFKDNHTVKTLNNLEYVGKDISISESDIEDLGKLKTIGKDAYLHVSKIKNLGNLDNVGGYLYLCATEVNDIGKLNSVKKCIVINDILTKEDFKDVQTRKIFTYGEYIEYQTVI